MASMTNTVYFCDKCGTALQGSSNHVVINTNVRDLSPAWSRLRITIEHHHGSHNDGTTEPAALCHRCAVLLLTDALARVTAGERVSAGVDRVELLNFNEE